MTGLPVATAVLIRFSCGSGSSRVVRSPPTEAGDVQPAHLLAFQVRAQAHADDRDVGVLHERFGLGQCDVGRRNPAELDHPARAGLPELDAHAVLAPGLQPHLRAASARRIVGAACVDVICVAGPPLKSSFLLVEEHADLAGAVPAPGADDQLVLARRRRRQRPRPSDRVVLATDGGHDLRGLHLHVEVGARLGPPELRRALEVGVVEVLGEQAVPLPVRRREEGRRHQRRRRAGVRGAEGIPDGRVREPRSMPSSGVTCFDEMPL